jgi:hypothetical protein
MGLQRGIDDSEPIRQIGDDATHEEHRAARTGVVAHGTLACPSCDAPVALGESRVSPRDPLMCPFCAHGAPARDFLSLEPPVRPTRVAVRITMPRVSPSRA